MSNPTEENIIEDELVITQPEIRYTLAGSCIIARYSCEGKPDLIKVDGDDSDMAGMIAVMSDAAGKRVTFAKDRKKKVAE